MFPSIVIAWGLFIFILKNIDSELVSSIVKII